MYAVINVGGSKQYRVKVGQTVRLEKHEVEVGTSIKFDKVLMISDGENTQVGIPHLAGFVVEADVVSQGRAKKIKIIKFRRRKHHKKQMGHRQWYTDVKITGIRAA